MDELAALKKVADCARATLIEQRREFARGDVADLDELEDALLALERIREALQ